MSAINVSFPWERVTPELETFSTTLRISYSWKLTGVNPAIFVALTWFKVTSIAPTVPPPTTVCSFLSSISNLSPTFNDDLSIFVLNLNVEPEISTWNLEDVL